MALSFQGPAPPNRYHFPTSPVANPNAVVQDPQRVSNWRFTLLSPYIVRFEWSPDGAFEDRASTFALNRNFNVPNFQVVSTETHLHIHTHAFELVYDRTEFSQDSLRIRAHDRTWLWQYSGKSYGDLGGTTRTLDGIDGRVDLPPGLVSRHQPYSVLDDSDTMLINANGWIGTRKPGRKDGYFFCFGPHYAAAIKCMYNISGPPPLLPRWALGNWWSRYHAYSGREYLHGYSGREYLQLMDKFLRNGIPLTAAVIDMYAYFDVLKAKIEAQGVDFSWVDWQQGRESKWPGVDPMCMLNHFHYLTSRRNASKNLEQPMILSRYAGPGSHRYPIGFSGDSIISWESLHFQPEFTATASNIGYGWWSHDIGGHYGGVRCSELAARWVQLGCFSPIMRLHSSKGPWISKENFDVATRRIMENFLRFRHCLIPYLYTMNVRAAYDLEPLVQPLYWKHADKPAYCYKYPNQFYFGPSLLVAPVTQPTSPCTRRAAVPVWLPGPAARYVDIFNPSLVYSGRGRPFVLHRVLDEIPVLAPEGTILVLDGTCLPTPSGVTLSYHSHGVGRPAVIEIWLVVGASASFTLYEEPLPSGTVATTPPRQALSAIPIFWDQASGILTIGPAQNPHPENTNRIWRVRLIGCYHPSYPDGLIHLDTHEIGTPGGVGIVRLAPGRILDRVDIRKKIKEVINKAQIPYILKDKIWKVVMEDELRPVGERVRRLWAMKRVDKALKAAVMEVWASDGRSQGNAVGWEMWEVVEADGDDSSSDEEDDDGETLGDGEDDDDETLDGEKSEEDGSLDLRRMRRLELRRFMWWMRRLRLVRSSRQLRRVRRMRRLVLLRGRR